MSDDYNPKAGDIVTDRGPGAYGAKWTAKLWKVDRATASTAWLSGVPVGEESIVRRSKYSGWGLYLASDALTDAVKSRRKWIASRPSTRECGVHVLGGYGGHPLEGPNRIDVDRFNADEGAIRIRIDALTAVADWLAAEPKESTP